MTLHADSGLFDKPQAWWQPEPLVRPLIVIWVLLVASHFLVSPYRGGSSLSYTAETILERLVLDGEKNFGSWFAILLLATGGLLAGTTGWQTVVRHRTLALGWALLGLVMLAMSAEELLALHESTVAVLRSRLDASGFLTFTWVILGIPLAALVFAGGWPMLRRLPAAIKSQMIMAAAIFVLGSIGLEMIGGKLTSIGLGKSMAYALSTGIEESLELLAVLVGIDAILRFRRLEGLRATI